METLISLIGTWMLFAIWQSTLLLSIAILFAVVCKTSPGKVNVVCVSGIIAAACCPTFSTIISYWNIGVFNARYQITDSLRLFVHFSWVFGILVAIGAIGFALLLVYGIVLSRRLMFLAKPFADRELQDALLRNSAVLKNDSMPVLYTSHIVKSPTVWCWGLHPAILLPESLMENVSPEERDGIFLHELAHIVRWDHVMSLLVRVCSIVLFWNPLYWLTLHKVDLSADESCDLIVVSQGYISPETYTETLLRLVAGEKYKPEKYLSTLQFLSRKEKIMKRIERIFDFSEQTTPISATVSRMWSFSIIMLVSLMTVSLAFCQEQRENAGGEVKSRVETFDPTLAKEREAVIEAIAQSTKRISLPGCNDWTMTASLNKEGTLLITGSNEGDPTARVYSLENYKVLGELPNDSIVVDAYFHPTEPFIYTADRGEMIHVWDAKTFQKYGDFSPQPGAKVYKMIVSPKGECGIMGTDLGRVISWNLETGEKIKEFARQHREQIWTMDFSSDGKTFATGSADGSVCIWNIDQAEPLKVIPNAGKQTIQLVRFNADGTQLVVCSEHNDPYVHIYDVKTGKEIANIGGYGSQKSLMSAGFSPDGKYLATGDRDYRTAIWDLETKKPIWADHRTPGNHVYRVIFTPKQDYLIVLSGFGPVMLEMPKSFQISE